MPKETREEKKKKRLPGIETMYTSRLEPRKKKTTKLTHKRTEAIEIRTRAHRVGHLSWPPIKLLLYDYRGKHML